MRKVFPAVICATVCLAQPPAGSPTLQIPTVKTSLDLQGQPVEVSAWGALTAAPAGSFRLALTLDLGNFQENLTPILAAQLNRSDHCGERLTVQHAAVASAAPGALLTADFHYERFACAKAFGKDIVKRLAGGNGAVEVNLSPSIAENRIAMAAQVRKMDADGSLGDLLHSGSFGDSLRDKIAASIESAIQKSAIWKSTLPASMENLLTLQTVQFADGGSGRLWLNLTGDLRLSAEQFREVSRALSH